MTRASAYAVPTDRDQRDRLIVDHVPMARRIARRIARGSDPTTRDELEAVAMMGLVEAANRYDFFRSEPFPAFAYQRIRGAVIDSLRRSDVVPRRVRELLKRAARATTALEHELGRPPEDEEVAARLEIPIDQYRAEMQAVTEVSFVELGFDTQGTAEGDDPHRALERSEMVEMVRAGLARLEKRDGQLLMLYYVEELTYAEIARVFGISEPRVCQLHSRALVRLEAAMEVS